MAALVAGCTAVVTGANRGIGRAFVDELIRRGAARVYAGARKGNDVDPDLLGRGVVALELDVTDEDSVAAAAERCPKTTVVINNAGVFAQDRLILCADPRAARAEMEVNYFGVLAMTRAFAPVLAAQGGGAIVNVLSVAATVPAPFMGGYSPAKAAALFLSTIARAELEPQMTTVTALIVGSVQTRMSAHVAGAKESPERIAAVGLTAMERGDRVVDTDEMARAARAAHALDPARYERTMARLLHAPVLTTQP